MNEPPSHSYGPLSATLRSPSPIPGRRAFSLPTMRSYLPAGLASPAQLLPLSSIPSSPRKAKRLSYTLRSRAYHNKFRLMIGGLVIAAIFLYLQSSTQSLPMTRRFRTRDNQLVLNGGGRKPNGNGVSVMDFDDTDEWLAEDDLFYSQYTEDTPLSPEAAAAEAEMASRAADVVEQNRQQSLRALTWWLAEGGEIPDDWEVPSKAYLKKVGGRGVERMLEDIEDAELGDEPMFEEGWADFAKRRYRIIVFSKTHCPYSKRAKQILSQYHVTPAPFIVELDTRPDTAQLQDLLQHLTGRRTVPNILLDFVSIGGSDDLTLMHSEGGLQRRFEEMGALPGRGKLYQPAGKKPVPINPAVKPDLKVIAAPIKPDVAVAKKVDEVVGIKAEKKVPDAATQEEEGAYDDEEEEEEEEEVGDLGKKPDSTLPDMDEEEEDDEVLTPGARPEDIIAAVQAAHGNAYLDDGEDDARFANSEEFMQSPGKDGDSINDIHDEYPLGDNDEDYEDGDMEGDWALGEENDEEEDEDEDDITGMGAAANAKAAAAIEAEKAKMKAAEEARIEAEKAEAQVKAAAAIAEAKAKAAQLAEDLKKKAAEGIAKVAGGGLNGKARNNRPKRPKAKGKAIVNKPAVGIKVDIPAGDHLAQHPLPIPNAGKVDIPAEGALNKIRPPVLKAGNVPIEPAVDSKQKNVVPEVGVKAKGKKIGVKPGVKKVGAKPKVAAAGKPNVLPKGEVVVPPGGALPPPPPLVKHEAAHDEMVNKLDQTVHALHDEPAKVVKPVVEKAVKAAKAGAKKVGGGLKAAEKVVAAVNPGVKVAEKVVAGAKPVAKAAVKAVAGVKPVAKAAVKKVVGGNAGVRKPAGVPKKKGRVL